MTTSERLPHRISPFGGAAPTAKAYMSVSAVIVVGCLVGSLIADQTGRYYFWALLGIPSKPPLCNFSISARILFASLAALELAAIVAVSFRKFRHRTLKPIHQLSSLVTHSIGANGVRKPISSVLLLLFLHLGLYAVAFHADDVCSATRLGVWLLHYAALVAFSVLYCIGVLGVITFVATGLDACLSSE